jgi:S1-C subfamily serine protease
VHAEATSNIAALQATISEASDANVGLVKDMKKILLLLTAMLSLFTLGMAVINISIGNSEFVESSFESREPKINSDAFVYILNMGIVGNEIDLERVTIKKKGLRNGFAVGNGKYILTAAHCLADYKNSDRTLLQPVVISPYYGDVFEAEIVAIDKVNDIAILEPAWDAHPALELETSEKWEKSKTVKIIGYPPPAPCRGGNGSITHQILSEEVQLRTTKGKGSREVQVGPVNYPGKGWSGSPFISPKTGKVVGILTEEHYLKKHFLPKHHLIFGGSVNSIRQLFTDNNLYIGAADASLPNLGSTELFGQFLSVLDAQNYNGEEHLLLQELCTNSPKSHFPHILAGWVFNPPEDGPYYQKAVEIAPNSALARAAYGHHLYAQAQRAD